MPIGVLSSYSVLLNLSRHKEYCLAMAKNCPPKGQKNAMARQKLEWGLRSKKAYSRFYSSPFTFSSETPINTGDLRGEEWR